MSKEAKKEVIIDLEKAENILNDFSGRFEEGKKAVRFACETLAKELSECDEGTRSYVTDELKRRFDKSTVSQMLTAGRYWLSHTDCEINEYSRVYLIAKLDDKELPEVETYLSGKIADSSFRELKQAINCYRDDVKSTKSGRKNHASKWCPISKELTTYKYEIRYCKSLIITDEIADMHKSIIKADSDIDFTGKFEAWKRVHTEEVVISVTRITTTVAEIEYR